jgi:hypothetical protein
VSGFDIVLEWFDTAAEVDRMRVIHTNKDLTAAKYKARNMLRDKHHEANCIGTTVRVDDSHNEETLAVFDIIDDVTSERVMS